MIDKAVLFFIIFILTILILVLTVPIKIYFIISFTLAIMWLVLLYSGILEK